MKKIMLVVLFLMLPFTAKSEEEYGNYENVTSSIISLKLVENNVSIKTDYCSKIMIDGSVYLKNYQDWLKNNAVLVGYVDRFLKESDFKSSMNSNIRLAVLNDMKAKVDEFGVKPYCENFNKEMTENKYNFDTEPLKNHIEQYKYFMGEFEKGKLEFNQLKVAYSVYGATNYCTRKLKGGEEFLKSYNDWFAENNEVYKKALSKFTNIDLLEFVKMASNKNVVDFYNSIEDKSTTCLLLKKRLNENWFDLKKLDNNKVYDELMFILTGKM
ncbi:MAG: hypothetical protein BWY78_00941 [Alphaproteobacteria bacterium ADurb.Bin438]|nr:MAG: hypothetical protein BWY78_00941 [Alphaproteobacteria bacterium ADurb.Bin438]